MQQQTQFHLHTEMHAVKKFPGIAFMQSMFWLTAIAGLAYFFHSVLLLIFTSLLHLSAIHAMALKTYDDNPVAAYSSFVPLGVFLGLRLGIIKRLERQRQAVVRGEWAPLATPQPLPRVDGLALPITIQQRPVQRFFLGYFLVAVTFLGLLSIGLMMLSLGDLHSLTVDIFLVCFLGLLAVFFWHEYTTGKRQLTVTEDGLVVLGSGSKTRHIAWRDARLFAIDPPSFYRSNKQSITFELASADEVIQWTWLQPDQQNSFGSFQPTLPPEVYHRQMTALIELIAARTGLPLYDLRTRNETRKLF